MNRLATAIKVRSAASRSRSGASSRTRRTSSSSVISGSERASGCVKLGGALKKARGKGGRTDRSRSRPDFRMHTLTRIPSPSPMFAVASILVGVARLARRVECGVATGSEPSRAAAAAAVAGGERHSCRIGAGCAERGAAAESQVLTTLSLRLSREADCAYVRDPRSAVGAAAPHTLGSAPHRAVAGIAMKRCDK